MHFHENVMRTQRECANTQQISRQYGPECHIIDVTLFDITEAPDQSALAIHRHGVPCSPAITQPQHHKHYCWYLENKKTSSRLNKTIFSPCFKFVNKFLGYMQGSRMLLCELGYGVLVGLLTHTHSSPSDSRRQVSELRRLG